MHTLANGVVSVNAYGVLDTVTFPLACTIFKPQRRLKPGDVYQSKPQLAVDLIQELVAQGFHFSVVLADSLYGESYDFLSALHRLGLQYVVAIRSNHSVWTSPGERVRQTRWRPFDRLFTDGTTTALPLRIRLRQTHPDALLRGDDRSRPPAARDDLAPHDQPAG